MLSRGRIIELTHILLGVIAVITGLIWREVQSLNKFKIDEYNKQLKEKWAKESRAEWDEFVDARKDSNKWAEYLKKEGIK